MATSPGFVDLGEMIAGGGIDREGARLEGLDIGSKISARRATTANALALARLRADEADQRLNLADEIEALGGPKELATVIRAGGNPEQLTGAMGDIQSQGFRSTISDVGVPFEQRQASAQAIEGKVVDPFQFGPGGELFADVFNPPDAPLVSKTGGAAIGADRALVRQRVASARLSDEKRKFPERFKSTINIGTGGLVEELLGEGGEGATIVPSDINAEEAFGAGSFLKGGVNAVSDFIGAGTPFEDEAQANEVLGNLAVRTQIVMQARVPGRPSQFLLELLGTYAENPRQLFRGDAKATLRLENTVATLRQDLQRTKDVMNSSVKKTPTRIAELQDALLSIADLVADYEAILQSVKAGQAQTPEEATQTPGPTTTPAGGSFTVNP